MAGNPDTKQDEQRADTAGARFAAFLPLIIFIAVLAVFTGYWLNQQNQSRAARLKQAEANETRGLPRDYPAGVVPIHEEVEIVETERGSADAQDGGKLDKWYILGRFDGDRKQLLDYYNDLMIGRGMGQTHFISMPSHDGSGGNYAVAWADDEYLVDLSIEKLTSDELAQFKLTVYREK